MLISEAFGQDWVVELPEVVVDWPEVVVDWPDVVDDWPDVVDDWPVAAGELEQAARLSAATLVTMTAAIRMSISWVSARGEVYPDGPLGVTADGRRATDA